MYNELLKKVKAANESATIIHIVWLSFKTQL